MEAYASIDELKARLDFDLEPSEETMAEAALQDLSDDARYYGNKDWPLAAVPPFIKRLILKAAVRYMRNPDGYMVSRAGDETIQWAEDKSGDAGTAHFLKEEIEAIKELVYGKRGLHSVGVIAYGSTKQPSIPGLVPTDYKGVFPLFSDDQDPW